MAYSPELAEKGYDSTINKILRNEKYIGDALLQKTYTTDFLTKKRVKNNGIVPQYYVDNNHEAIIPKEIFMQVQNELVRRRVVHVSSSGKKRSFSSKTSFAQIIYCGQCGELYRRVHWNNHGCKSIVWHCISRLEPTSAKINCTNHTVNETLLKDVALKAMNCLISNGDAFIEQMQKNITMAIAEFDTASPTAIQKHMDELQKELIEKATNHQHYDTIADEIFRLREQTEEAERHEQRQQEKLEHLKELQDFIQK